jgi:hypothetical protein
LWCASTPSPSSVPFGPATTDVSVADRVRLEAVVIVAEKHDAESAFGRYCCKRILRVRASNIDSRSGANAQRRFKNLFVPIRLLRIFTRKLLLADFCNNIGTKQEDIAVQQVVRY